jgi:hypothetical protein
MPDTDRTELIDQLLCETAAGATTAPRVSVLVAAALLASSPDLLAEAMQSATTTADRQFVAIAAAHLAGDHDRIEALARDHLLDHPSRPLLAWIVDHSHARDNGPTTESTTEQGARP